MIYFTGTYPLFHSTLYSNDVFKNTFIAKSSPQTYYDVEYNLDLLLRYEELLSVTYAELNFSAEYDNNLNRLKLLNDKINSLKKSILEKTLETQNIIITNCFCNEFDLIKNLNDIKEFQENLYNFKSVLINSENYDFYNTFYCEMMSKLEEKRELINQYGDITYNENITYELANINNNIYGYKLALTFFEKIKLLLHEKLRVKDL